MRRLLLQFDFSTLDEDAGEKKQDCIWPTEMVSCTTVQTHKQDCKEIS